LDSVADAQAASNIPTIIKSVIPNIDLVIFIFYFFSISSTSKISDLTLIIDGMRLVIVPILQDYKRILI